MFDISWTELLVIVVVAVVVVGPKDLPRLMRTVGQWAGRARAMADQFRRSFDDMARQTELDELRREVQKLQQAPIGPTDYESFGVKESDFPSPSASAIEDVGASPPKLDSSTSDALSETGRLGIGSPLEPPAATPSAAPAPASAPVPTTSSQA